VSERGQYGADLRKAMAAKAKADAASAAAVHLIKPEPESVPVQAVPVERTYAAKTSKKEQ
jgi:hypothetical protein